MEKYVSSEVKPKKSLEELRREGVELKRKINEARGVEVYRPEQFGDHTLQAAQDIYANEARSLEEKASRYNWLNDIVVYLGVPGAIHMAAKIFNMDLNVSDSADAILQLSFWGTIIGAGITNTLSYHFESKLNHLKEKFGILEK